MPPVIAVSVHDIRDQPVGRRPSWGLRLVASASVVASFAALLTVTGFAAAVRPRPAVHAAAVAAAPGPGARGSQDWPTYLHDAARSSSSGDAILNTANVGGLVKKWTYTTGGFVAASPAVVNGIVYVGSWDGNEYALDGTTGAVIWQTNLGTTFDPPCVPPHLGVTSSATVTNGVVYVGGGDAYWYALNATSGAVLWRIFTGDNTQAGAHYNWSSPLIIGNFGYIGIASNCDAPLVQGQVLKVDLTTHRVVGIATMVPDGQVGGGVWTSPTFDAATNTIFVSTGTLNLYSQTMSQAIVAIDAGTMAIRDHWQLPFEAAVSDSDWGTTPTLTTDAQGRQLVSVVNKNGALYTLQRNNLAAGPVWQRVIAIGGDCPPCGDGSIASAAFAKGVLYQAGGSNVSNGVGHKGSVSALNPGTGALEWYHPTNEAVIGSIAYANGLIFVPQGQVVEVLDAANGNSLWTYKLNGSTYAAPAISHGILYIGGLDNQVHAFGLPTVDAYVTNISANTVTEYVAGITTPIRTIGGVATGLNGPDGIAIDAAGTLYVTNISANTITEYAAGVTGNVAPIRTIGGAATGLSTPAGVTLDATGTLYVPNVNGNSITEYPSSANGNVAPIRTVRGAATGLVNPERVAIDSAGVVMVANYGASSITEYAAGATGNVGPVRMISGPATGLSGPVGLALDSAGELYVANFNISSVTEYTPGATGNVTPARSIGGAATGLNYPQGLVLDAGGNLAVANAGGNSVTAYLAGTSGNAPPAATLSGAGTGISGPVDVAIVPAGAETLSPPDPNCPAGFTCRDLGSPALAGTEQTNPDGTITATAPSYGSGRQISEPVSGDFQLTTKVLSITGGPGWGAAGLEVRQSNDPASPSYVATMIPNFAPENLALPSVLMTYKEQFGAPAVELTHAYPQTFPRWIMIQRHGDTFQTLTSGDGTNWTLIGGSIHTFVMPTTLLVGVSLFSVDPNMQTVATFTKPVVGPATQTYARQMIGHPCPATWSCEDIAAGSPPGDQTLVNGTWTVYGDASGITGSSDQFHYVFRTLPGDGTVTARLTSMGNATAAAQGAVLMRADDSQGSAYYGIVVHGDGSAKVQWRENSNLTTRPTAVMPAQTLPRWYQVQRYTDTAHTPVLTYYTALSSPDGVTWTQVPGSTVALNLGATPLAGIGGSSYDGSGRTLNPSTWDNVATSTVRVPAPGICPGTFTCQDVGVGYAPGTQTLSNGTWTLQAGGADIWDAYDEFRFITQPMTADGTISARVVSVGQNPQGYQKAGVMVRTSADPQAAYYGVFQTPAHGILVQWRTAPAGLTSQIAIPGPATPYPVYVMIGRWTDPKTGGTSYTAYTSTDNKNFTAVPGSTMVLTMPGTLLAGLAADSYDQKTTFPVTFDSLALLDHTEPIPPGACPASFAGCADIGGATPGGSQTLAGGTLTAQVGGGDIWSTADQLHLVWQTLATDGSVSARVATQQNTGPWAKAGVMLRATTAAGSPYYGIFVTPTNGIVVQYRTTTGATTNGIFIAGAAPAYLKVSKYTDGGGTVFYTASTSPDGVTWTAVPASTVSFPMPGTLLAGYGADAYSQAVSGTVVFDTLSVSATGTPPPSACLAPWSCTDIGGATPAGTQTIAGTNTTVAGGGGDIWDVSDQFRLVSQPLAADGTVTAQVTSQQATAPWAKAGVMMRATAAPGSPYYAVFVTPANGLVVQWRSAQGATTNQLAMAGAVPLHLQLSRWTNVTTGITYYSAFRSADGATWTLVPGSTVALAMPGTLLTGPAVTSHNTTALSQAMYTALTIGTTSTKPPGL